MSRPRPLPRWRARRAVLGAALAALTPLAAAGRAGAQERAPADPPPPNLLLVVLDDVGVDYVGAYGEHPRAGPTPTLDALAARGVRFTNVWAMPWCSPTRATLLTGCYPFRTGIGDVLHAYDPGPGLAPDALTLPRALPAGYASAALGKWHLAGRGQGIDHPLAVGFDRFAGSLGNIPDYRSWTKVEDGRERACTRYATSEVTDDALRFVQRADGPWFLYLAYHAAHKPFHHPPPELCSPFRRDDPARLMQAMVEALDRELGRLLAAVDPARTVVLVVGDNGTHPAAIRRPLRASQGKGSLGQGGLRVPLIVAGPGVATGVSAAPVNTTDLFATLVALAGGSAGAPDSFDLGALLRDPAAEGPRRIQYAEAFRDVAGGRRSYERALSDGHLKLVVEDDPHVSRRRRLYDLDADPREEVDLLGREEPLDEGRRATLARLEVQLAELEAQSADAGPADGGR